jgi:endonuclease YncB( thermonuclease family)
MRYGHFTRILLVGALLLPLCTFAESLVGVVVGVSDGDTVTVLDAGKKQWKIRLMGIDAPEKKMPYGQQSKKHLSDLVFNKQVAVEYSKKDKYGRTVGKIVVAGGDANLEQLKAGLAWHYKKYEREQDLQDRLIYAEAEEQARAGRLGLWSDPSPVPPWDWRKQQRKRD